MESFSNQIHLALRVRMVFPFPPWRQSPFDCPWWSHRIIIVRVSLSAAATLFLFLPSVNVVTASIFHFRCHFPFVTNRERRVNSRNAATAAIRICFCFCHDYFPVCVFSIQAVAHCRKEPYGGCFVVPKNGLVRWWRRERAIFYHCKLGAESLCTTTTTPPPPPLLNVGQIRRLFACQWLSRRRCSKRPVLRDCIEISVKSFCARYILKSIHQNLILVHFGARPANGDECLWNKRGHLRTMIFQVVST